MSKQLNELRDGRNVLTIWQLSEEDFALVTLLLPEDMTKTDLPEQGYIHLPKKFVSELCETLLQERT